MKIALYKIVLCLIVFTLFSISCKKKKQNDPTPSKTEILTYKSWVFSAMKFSPAIQIDSFPIPISDIYPFMQECATDNFLTFKSDYSFISDEGALKCDTALPQTTSGTWHFNPDETQITFSSFNGLEGEVTFDMVELSRDKFSYRYIINSIGDLAQYFDTTGYSNMVTIAPGTKFTVTMIPK